MMKNLQIKMKYKNIKKNPKLIKRIAPILIDKVLMKVQKMEDEE